MKTTGLRRSTACAEGSKLSSQARYPVTVDQVWTITSTVSTLVLPSPTLDTRSTPWFKRRPSSCQMLVHVRPFRATRATSGLTASSDMLAHGEKMATHACGSHVEQGEAARTMASTIVRPLCRLPRSVTTAFQQKG